MELYFRAHQRLAVQPALFLMDLRQLEELLLVLGVSFLLSLEETSNLSDWSSTGFCRRLWGLRGIFQTRIISAGDSQATRASILGGNHLQNRTLNRFHLHSSKIVIPKPNVKFYAL
ncbi:uncharacterized protein LOC124297564 isoform X1 [Neodiprion virginianus]|uniref:uncharacterized protein LOC124297564 isoform X1 n=1 Tax=Neodiprion virginianus TaxID=2961670 RepID=UPI001EE6DD71|nr:uncharacterized protein LOC124297564 isoform X1 [Neodiprion virginianus]